MTQLPAPITTGAAWDRRLSVEYGDTIGIQEKASGVSYVLAPMVNIIRSELGGRTSESISEDPYLTMSLGVAEGQGLNDSGEGWVLKHFAAYNQSTGQTSASGDNDVISQQALREVYLPAFSAIVQDDHPAGVMCSMNKINGTSACNDAELLRTILRDEWHYGGIVRTDCLGAVTDPTAFTDLAVAAGVALVKCGPSTMSPSPGIGDNPLAISRTGPAAAPGNNTVYNPRYLASHFTKPTLEALADPYLRAIFSANFVTDPQTGTPEETADQRQGAAIALQANDEGSVLLTNHHNLLPLATSDSLEVVGVGAEAQGWAYRVQVGSDTVSAPQTGEESPATALSDAGFDVAYETEDASYSENSAGTAFNALADEPTAAQIAAAAAEASNVDVAIVEISQPSTEWQDRSSDQLPAGEYQMVKAVAAANPDTIVIIDAGQPVYLGPIQTEAKAIVDMWYPGQEASQALAQIIDGTTDPSGQLPLIWPATPAAHQAVTVPSSFGGVNGNVDYDQSNADGIDVGYRWYQAHHVKPAYPFGYGLTYTRFAWSQLTVRADTNGAYMVSAVVTNTGHTAGAVTTQLYVTSPTGTTASGEGNEPPQQLRGFQRIQLHPGQSNTVHFTLTPGDLAHWNPTANTWRDPGGNITISVGRSSTQLPLRTTINTPWRQLGTNSGPTPAT